MADDVQVLSGLTGTEGKRPRLRVSLLGSMQVDVDGRPMHVAGRQRRRMLALMAMRSGRVVPVEALVDAMWGDDPPPSAGKTVLSHIVRLRQSLAAAGDPIETTPGGYRLALETPNTDVAQFEDLVAAGAAEWPAAA
jgi:DNA-binding SARP family transcriptional activator